MKARLRYIRTEVAADAPPATTSLTDEGFDAGTLDTQVDETTTTATAHTGSGTCKFTDEWSLTGGLSNKASGTAQDYVTFTLDTDGATRATHADHYTSMYIKYGQQPGATFWFYSLSDGSDTVTAAKIGVDSTGHLVISDG